MPHTYAHCVTPSPLNVQLMLRGRKVNMSTAPNYILLCAYPVGNLSQTINFIQPNLQLVVLDNNYQVFLDLKIRESGLTNTP